MPASKPQPYAAFRLNLEQQKKRAKELLKAAQNADSTALQRLQHSGARPDVLTPAAAQHCIAREPRFANWAALKQHIDAMAQTRAALEADTRALDGDCRTMHIRCGNDIQNTLKAAGLHGDFNLHINPYLEGPVTAAPDWLEQRASFIADNYRADTGHDYQKTLEACRDEERRLASASRDYPRVVLWFEHDRYDQFVLIRCLAWFAEHGAPLLPDLARALHRHLQELPSVKNGLGLSEQLLLETLAEGGPMPAGRLVGLLMHQRDPLPGLGDLSYARILEGLNMGRNALVSREGGGDLAKWHLHTISITDLGRAVLNGERNWLELPVAKRIVGGAFVGGVNIVPSQQNWLWDESRCSVMLR